MHRYKNSKGASVAAPWIMSVKITGWSPGYTNRMCHGGHMGVLQPGDLPPHSFCRQIYHPEVKGGTPAEERRPRCGRSVGGGGRQASLLLRVFFSPLWKTRGFAGCSPRARVHKAREERAAATCLRSNAIPRGWPLLTFITVNTLCSLLSCLAQPLATFMCGSCLINLGDTLKAHLYAPSIHINGYEMQRRKKIGRSS